MSMALLTACIHELRSVRSWQLHRISPTTYTHDLRLSPNLSGMIRAGRCYRCKIGRGKWFYGIDPLSAVHDAMKYAEARP